MRGFYKKLFLFVISFGFGILVATAALGSAFEKSYLIPKVNAGPLTLYKSTEEAEGVLKYFDILYWISFSLIGVGGIGSLLLIVGRKVKAEGPGI